jgi:tRNA A-37 threonylcarbamoyl transferase component Bud32/tetratricopeptide (TPR) repeat protein
MSTDTPPADIGSASLPIVELVRRFSLYADDCELALQAGDTELPQIAPYLEGSPPEIVEELRRQLDEHKEKLEKDRAKLEGSPPEGVPAWRPDGYDVLEKKAETPNATVYKARQLKLNRLVALKAFKAGGHATEMQRLGFRKQAEILASLKHPHIVEVYDVGEHQGVPWLTMEWVDGGDLAAHLEDFSQPPEAAKLVETLARAVHSAHVKGIIHRDLKPANILLSKERTPKIADFGIALELGSEGGAAESDCLIGSPAYMAPEQAGGKEGLTTLTDVYGLGAILYQLLTGVPPFEGGTVTTVLQRVGTEQPVSPRQHNPKVPLDLNAICLKCLEKDPTERYDGALELARDLCRFLAGEPTSARKVGVAERVWMRAKRQPAVVSLLGILLLALFGAGVALVASYIDNQRQRVLAQSRAEEADRARVLMEGERDRANRLAEDARRAEAKAIIARNDMMKERNRATVEALKAKAFLDTLADPFDDPFGVSGAFLRSSHEAGERRSVRALLEHGLQRARPSVVPDVEVRTAILETLGGAYQNLALYDAAEPCLVKALAVRQEAGGLDPLALAASHRALGRFYHERGRVKDYRDARTQYDLALDIQKQHLPASAPALAETQYCRAWLAVELEEYAQGQRLFHEVIELHHEHPGHFPKPSRLLVLAEIGLTSADLEERVARGQEPDLGTVSTFLKHSKKLLDQDGDPDWKDAFGKLQVGLAAAGVATAFSRVLRVPGSELFAERAFRECDSLIASRKGDDHFYRIIPLLLLANTLETARRPAEADDEYRKLFSVVQRSVGFQHVHMPTAVRLYANFLHRQGMTAAAYCYFEAVLDALEKRFDDDHPVVAAARITFAGFLLEIKDFRGAERECQIAHEIYHKLQWDEHIRCKKCQELQELAVQGQRK